MVTKIKWYLAICFLISTVAVNAQKQTISGYLKDSLTNDFLIGATIQIAKTSIGTSSNAYGFYSLQVDKGKVTLLINYVGYEPKIINLQVESNISLDVALREKSQTLSEVVVSSQKANQKIISTEMSTDKISAKDIKQIPMVLGEADVIKSIQLLPGVTAPNEGSGGFNVRGGSADQNLIRWFQSASAKSGV